MLPLSLAWDENDGSKEAVVELVMAISSRWGGRDRLYRNALVFLVGTARRAEEAAGGGAQGGR